MASKLHPDPESDALRDISTPALIISVEALDRNIEHMANLAAALAAAGLPPGCISGSGTGTSSFDFVGPYTELQVGSYVFMDGVHLLHHVKQMVDRRGLHSVGLYRPASPGAGEQDLPRTATAS